MFLDELVPNTDIGQWLEEEKSKEENKGGFVPEYVLKEKSPDNIGLINFLSEGLRLSFHTMKTVLKGKTVFVKVICKGPNCPLCMAGHVAREQGVYPLVDWDNGFTDKKTNKKIKFPTVKFLIKGVNTVKLIERRRAKLGTLLNRMFEVTREGTGFDTVYDFMPEKDHVPDFAEVKVGDKGTTSFVIKRPESWPSPVPGSILDIKKVNTPDYPIDWHNPKHVNMYVQLYLLNANPEFYKASNIQPDNNESTADELNPSLPY